MQHPVGSGPCVLHAALHSKRCHLAIRLSAVRHGMPDSKVVEQPLQPLRRRCGPQNFGNFLVRANDFSTYFFWEASANCSQTLNKSNSRDLSSRKVYLGQHFRGCALPSLAPYCRLKFLGGLSLPPGSSWQAQCQ